jgi:hypothetical protein
MNDSAMHERIEVKAGLPGRDSEKMLLVQSYLILLYFDPMNARNLACNNEPVIYSSYLVILLTCCSHAKLRISHSGPGCLHL